ncbi:sulfurtransferase TusA family protein [Halococcus saccharolyticus]|uniref:SirA family protein n=1 Tax=Halococcus saccharolyticus DSM 5350 TaxID=1227455 RepID=M0MCX5_9EURY|nr:sulfurtransferase TusA family protein [Halococcus saccharolyticus]EMA43203.1 SirA family protein [Halococcus saccharolyticus DSM 5350]
MEEVDVTGAVCPKPALIVRRCLQELDAGDELLVTGDYPPAERNLRRTCHKHGFAVTDGPDDTPDDTFQLRIGVTEESALDERRSRA